MKFNVVDYIEVDFNETARSEVNQLNSFDENEKRKILNRMCKDNIAQLIELELVQHDDSRGMYYQNRVCLVNTHLYSNYRRADVKLWQTYTLMSNIQRYISIRNHQGADVPIVICGDFNSEPNSAVYSFLEHGQISSTHPDLDLEGDGNNQSLLLNSVLPDISRITHNIKLSSAMSCAIEKEPTYTNYTGGFKGTLDYIWFNEGLKVVSALNIPPESEILKYGIALPNSCFPSDHVSICCDFEFEHMYYGNDNEQHNLYQGHNSMKMNMNNKSMKKNSYR